MSLCLFLSSMYVTKNVFNNTPNRRNWTFVVRANTAEFTVNMGKVGSLMPDNLRKVDILQFL